MVQRKPIPLLERQKCNETLRDLANRDIVFIGDATEPWNSWMIGKIIKLSLTNLMWSDLFISKQPVTKMCLLAENVKLSRCKFALFINWKFLYLCHKVIKFEDGLILVWILVYGFICMYNCKCYVLCSHEQFGTCCVKAISMVVWVVLWVLLIVHLRWLTKWCRCGTQRKNCFCWLLVSFGRAKFRPFGPNHGSGEVLHLLFWFGSKLKSLKVWTKWSRYEGAFNLSLRHNWIGVSQCALAQENRNQ